MINQRLKAHTARLKKTTDRNFFSLMNEYQHSSTSRINRQISSIPCIIRRNRRMRTTLPSVKMQSVFATLYFEYHTRVSRRSLMTAVTVWQGINRKKYHAAEAANSSLLYCCIFLFSKSINIFYTNKSARAQCDSRSRKPMHWIAT